MRRTHKIKIQIQITIRYGLMKKWVNLPIETSMHKWRDLFINLHTQRNAFFFNKIASQHNAHKGTIYSN